MSYRIGSFNVCNWSGSGYQDQIANQNARSVHKLNRIAEIIRGGNENGKKDEPLDIVAFQEVLSEGRMLEALTRQLGADWQCSWGKPKDDPSCKDDKREEGYGFLWNTKRFELIRVDKGENPCILENYHVTNGINRTRLKRDPFYGRFRDKRLKIELRLITTHIVFNAPNALKTGTTGALESPVAMRKNEFNILLGDIYNSYTCVMDDVLNLRQDLRRSAPSGSKPSVWYTILLGDYNLNLGTDIPAIACFNGKGRRLDGIQDGPRVIYTVQKEPTTLGKARYANNYDHFSYDERTRSAIIKGEARRIDAVHRYAPTSAQTEEEKFADYHSSVSDHVPIVIEIDFK